VLETVGEQIMMRVAATPTRAPVALADNEDTATRAKAGNALLHLTAVVLRTLGAVSAVAADVLGKRGQ
jgi:hypothetical protein